MKAVICPNYGSPEVLKIKEIEKPIPKDGEVLIRVNATSAHIGDTRIRRCDPFFVRLVFGLFKPKKNLVLGLEVSGVVESVGQDVKTFNKGDEVFALAGFNLGGYAEYICLPERVRQGTQEQRGLISLKPKNLSFQEAATVPAGALTVLKNIEKAKKIKSKKILIYGASGSLGTYFIQFAKYYGAEVTAVCSKDNFELVKSLGADNTIDYREEDFTTLGIKYDIIYDAVMKLKHSDCKRVLNKSGIFLNNSGLPKIVDSDLNRLKEMIEDGIFRPVIDRSYTLNEIVEAHRYVDKGHKRGNVPITVRK